MSDNLGDYSLIELLEEFIDDSSLEGKFDNS